MPRFKIRGYPYSVDVATFAGVLVGNSSSLNPTDYVCLESYFLPKPGQPLIIFDNSQSGTTNSYFLSCDGSTGNVSWFSTIGGVAKNILTSTLKAVPNQWNFVSAFYDGSQIQICLNGASAATLAASGSLGTNSGQLRIGQYFNAGVPSFGRITQTRIYHRVYTLADHQARYYEDKDDSAARSGLVLEYLYSEGSGTSVADSSGSGNTGAFSRNVWTTDVPFSVRTAVSNRSAVANRRKIRTISSAARFNGTSSQIDLGASGAIAASTATFSCAAYFRRDKAIAGITAIVGDNNNAAQNHWNFQVQGPGRKLLTTIITSVGTKALVGSANIPLFEWCHAVLVYDGANIIWYYNGLFDISTTHTGTILASTSGMLLGTGSAPIGGAYRYWGGAISEVKYWNRALTAAEVASLYFDNANDSSIRTGLQGEWLLAGNANDTSGNGNNGTVTSVTYDSTDVPFKDRTLIS